MKDLSNEIVHYSRKFQIECPQYNADKSCERPGGCVCAKYGEIYALIHSLIKPEYRKANINSFTGTLPNGKRAIERPKAVEIRNKLWNYLYGDAEYKAGLTRKELNLQSEMDKRFLHGTNLVIFGESHHVEKDGGLYTKKHTPMGKTLMASIVMIDAIYRRAFPTNKAMTYDWISFLQLRQMLKQKKSSLLIETQEADWLVIDDLSIIDKGDFSRANAWTKEVFDAFLIERIEQRKPTLLVCNFDISKVSLEEKMGAAFEKIVTSNNTHLIKVEGSIR